MNGVIPLDAVLREATRQAYRDLVTRPTGAAVRHRLVSTLRDHDRTEALLDFSRIGLVDFSCADEVVAKLVAPMLQRFMATDKGFNKAKRTTQH